MDVAVKRPYAYVIVYIAFVILHFLIHLLVKQQWVFLEVIPHLSHIVWYINSVQM
jgi:hypothetical protein